VSLSANRVTYIVLQLAPVLLRLVVVAEVAIAVVLGTDAQLLQLIDARNWLKTSFAARPSLGRITNCIILCSSFTCQSRLSKFEKLKICRKTPTVTFH